MSGLEDTAVPARYKRWLILSTVVLLLSLVLLLCNIVATFVYFSARSTPVWVTALSVTSIFGMVAGFGGLFLLLGIAGGRAWRSDKKRAAKLG